MASAINNKMEPKRPLDVCPEKKIWRKIRHYLTDPYDLVNFAKSSLDFELIVMEKYPPFVLRFIEVFKHVAPYIEAKRAREYRTTCRHWNKLFTSHLDSIYGSVNTFFKWTRPDLKFDQGQVNFQSLSTLAIWEENMKPSLTNPVACRIVCMEPQLKKGVRTFFARSISHFSTWGHHTWNLQFNFTNCDPFLSQQQTANDPDIFDALKYIQNCLRHVPNLKTLNLDTIITWIGDPQDVKKWLKTHPFPPLPNLAHINVKEAILVSTSVIPVWEGLLEAYRHTLESLSITESVHMKAFNTVSLPRLSALTLALNGSDLETVVTVAKRSQWKLRELDVNLQDALNEKTWPMFLLLILYSKRTLETLKIKLKSPTHKDNGESHFKRVTLPNLKRFELMSSKFGLKSLEFLDQFSPNLKTMIIRERLNSNFVEPPTKPHIASYEHCAVAGKQSPDNPFMHDVVFMVKTRFDFLK